MWLCSGCLVSYFPAPRCTEASSAGSGSFIIKHHVTRFFCFFFFFFIAWYSVCCCSWIIHTAWDYSLAGPLFSCIILWRPTTSVRLSLEWNKYWRVCQDYVGMSGHWVWRPSVNVQCDHFWFTRGGRLTCLCSVSTPIRSYSNPECENSLQSCIHKLCCVSIKQNRSWHDEILTFGKRGTKGMD